MVKHNTMTMMKMKMKGNNNNNNNSHTVAHKTTKMKHLMKERSKAQMYLTAASKAHNIQTLFLCNCLSNRNIHKSIIYNPPLTPVLMISLKKSAESSTGLNNTMSQLSPSSKRTIFITITITITNKGLPLSRKINAHYTSI